MSESPEEQSDAGDRSRAGARSAVRTRGRWTPMVHSETPGPAGGDQSLGDLVALAAKDVSQLIRYEIDLAKTELKGDARRVGIAVAGFGLAAFVGCLVLILLCIALAFGLVALGIGTWAAFLIVAGLLVLLAGGGVFLAIMKLKRLSGLQVTR